MTVLKGWQIRYSYIHCLCSVSTRNTQCFIEVDSVRLCLPESHTDRLFDAVAAFKRKALSRKALLFGVTQNYFLDIN